MICNILMCICPKDFALQNPTVLSFDSSDKISHESFLEDLIRQLETLKMQYGLSEFIILGDFNMISDKQVDALGG